MTSGRRGGRFTTEALRYGPSALHHRDTETQRTPEDISALWFCVGGNALYSQLRNPGSTEVWYAAFVTHCSLFPTASMIAKFKDELEGYKTSKGTIQFPTDKPMPAALIKKIVKARLAEIEQ